ncbi:MAG: HAD family hydrolase [Deltaproteobacteria bacterium]|nr:HAD family hydrolase [Deltaproteobacteria bacterium]
MNTLRVRGVIFDVDGTLADSVGFFYEIALEVLKLAGAPPASKERVYELMRLGDAAPLEKLFPPDFPDPAATLKRIVDDRMHEWMRRYHHETEAIPGSIELLHDLYTRGLRLGIATSSGRALPFLDRWGVRHLFSGIVGREDVEVRKPHPEPVLKCLGHLGLDPHEVVYIGDSPIDIRAGKAAGSYTVGVLTGTSPRDVLHREDPDHILESVAGLHGILHW